MAASQRCVKWSLGPKSMSSDLLAVLDLDKELSSSKVIVAKEINGCDSSFITSCILGHCVKNKMAVLVILTHNSCKHYQYVGLKMNYNLQRSQDEGQIYFLNAGEHFMKMFLDDEDVSLQKFMPEMQNKILAMQEKYGAVNIIFEGLAHLCDLQLTLKEVNKICKVIINIIRKNDNSFLMLHCNIADCNDTTHVLTNLLSHMSDTIIEVENFSSGWSADVSGHLAVKHQSQKFKERLLTLEQKPYQYLFKLYERGVKLYAPGTV